MPEKNNESTVVLDFSHISREIRSLVSRRRELMLFLGSLFAAMGIFLDNVLHGSLPPSLEGISDHAFLTYALILLLPTLIIALRLSRLYKGMIINGVFYRRVLFFHELTKAHPSGSARLNWFGVSTWLFLLCALLSGLAAALMALALGFGGVFSPLAGIAVVAGLVLIFRYQHRSAAQFALGHIEGSEAEPVDPEEVEDHLAASLEDANHDMIAVVAFVGLMLFSVLENLSGLGDIEHGGGQFAAADVVSYGAILYGLLAMVSGIVGVVIYLRLAVAIGKLSLELDPSDRPYRPLRMTDSLLGYLLLVFLTGIGGHLLIYMMGLREASLWTLTLLCLLVLVAAYPLTIAWAGEQAKSPS